MAFLSLNHLFWVNALVLLLLGFWQLRSGGLVAKVFFASCVGLATWNTSNFLIEEQLLPGAIDLLGHFQLFGAMLFACSLLYLAHTYPRITIGWWHLPNMLAFLGLCAGIFFTELVSTARIEDGQVLYNDGPGWLVYGLYLMAVGLSAIGKFLHSYYRLPEERDRMRWFIIGLAIYIPAALCCNVVLPGLGNYDYLLVGRLSATLVPLLIFYAMTKHEFLDASVIINRQTAWACVLILLLIAVAVVQQLAAVSHLWHVLAMSLLVLAAALFAHPLQRFLLTTAKRKFVRGWYATEEVFHTLAGRITQEKDREAIFREVLGVLDEVFELETSLSIVAVRDELEQFSFYRVNGSLQRVHAGDPLIEVLARTTYSLPLAAAPVELRQRVRELGFRGELDKAVLLPFHSPEYLEGILVLGERSNQQGFSDTDRKFFDSLISFIAPVLYRLTPMEKLEQLYNESRRRLHEAEIQLIRAQKVEAIVHATRQCHHEIRTPLNIIRMGIGRIRTLEDLVSYKEVAREEIDHALRVVEETLAVTDVSSRAVRHFVPVDLNDLVQRSLRLIDRSRYQVVLDLGELPPVPALGSDIQVVLINLIHNAMDAMPEGGTLAFSTRRLEHVVEVCVEDTGAGIPEELHPRVWEPYVSGKPTEAGNSTAGRGWGLTIVNRIINQHAGTIRFSSVEGHGTRFVFTLPLEQLRTEISDEPEPDAEGGEERS
jgi:two-component system NtrC family sensor kinase